MVKHISYWKKVIYRFVCPFVWPIIDRRKGMFDQCFAEFEDVKWSRIGNFCENKLTWQVYVNNTNCRITVFYNNKLVTKGGNPRYEDEYLRHYWPTMFVWPMFCQNTSFLFDQVTGIDIDRQICLANGHQKLLNLLIIWI